MDTIDIRREIDRSFGDGPETGASDAIVDDLLSRGRRVVHRRRALIATGAAAVAVALVVNTTAAVGGSWGGAGGHTPVADAPGLSGTGGSTATADPTRTPSRKEIAHALGQHLVEYDSSGHLVVDPAATVIRQIDNPFDVPAGDRSVAVVLAYEGATYWFALEWEHDGSGSDSGIWAGDRRELTFGAWVARNKPTHPLHRDQSGPGGWPGIPDLHAVQFVGDTEQLAPVDGTTILEQRAHVQVGESFAGPSDQTAAADVRTSDGNLYYVLARRSDGSTPQYIAVPHDVGGATLDDFITLARQRYATGGGGLL